MVVVRAVTFNLISALGHYLWSTTTTLSEKAINVYEYGLACDSFADCGGFSWNEGKCQLVARVGFAVARPLESNIYRMATFRGKRIIDRHKNTEEMGYLEYKDTCANWTMMMIPPPLNSREQMTVSIRRGYEMPIGGTLNDTGFTDDFGNFFSKDDTVIPWAVDHPVSGRQIVTLCAGYHWTSYFDWIRPDYYHLMCMEI